MKLCALYDFLNGFQSVEKCTKSRYHQFIQCAREIQDKDLTEVGEHEQKAAMRG